jgi:2-methylisocitrate lyase-like PEP mutase family enzyme
MKRFEVLRAQLKHKIDQGELVVALGAHDALSARAFEKAGYEAVYMTGHGVGAAMLAWTDVGLTTMTEMVWAAKNICNAINVPLIADMDTGYGNAVNVVRAVREFEQAGVAMVQFEDQAMPKKCGFMKGKALISKEEMVAKIRAAVDAREDPNFMLVARCDARAVEGSDSMYDRLEAYAAAGADLVYAEAPRNADDVREDARRLKGKARSYLIGCWLGPRYGLTFQEVAALGYSVMILPEIGFTVAPKALYDVALEMRKTGIYPDLVAQGRQFTWNEVQELIRLPEVQHLENTYLPTDVKLGRWKSEGVPEAGSYYIDGMHDVPKSSGT